MTLTFVDSSALIALVDRNDRHHRSAERTPGVLAKAKLPLMTSTDVADEVIALLRRRMGHATAVPAGEALLRSRWCGLLDIDATIREAAWNIFVRYDGQLFLLHKLHLFALMRALGSKEAFTYDRADFSAAGFVVVPAR